MSCPQLDPSTRPFCSTASSSLFHAIPISAPPLFPFTSLLVPSPELALFCSLLFLPLPSKTPRFHGLAENVALGEAMSFFVPSFEAGSGKKRHLVRPPYTTVHAQLYHFDYHGKPWRARLALRLTHVNCRNICETEPVGLVDWNIHRPSIMRALIGSPADI
jgi:hypothetical protein